MTALQPLNSYSFFGRAWSFWPPSDSRGAFNVVSGVRQISHAILSLCLIRKGEDYIHPDFGLAPDLFEPTSNFDPYYLVYHLEQEIQKWVAGIESLSTRVAGYDSRDNKISIEVSFVPQQLPGVHVLAFPLYQYQGAIMDGAMQPFIASVQLDGNPFFSLAA